MLKCLPKTDDIINKLLFSEGNMKTNTFKSMLDTFGEAEGTCFRVMLKNGSVLPGGKYGISGNKVMCGGKAVASLKDVCYVEIERQD